MSATVRLKDIVDALEMQMDEQLSFVDLDSGKVETVARDLMSEAEESDEGEEVEDEEGPEWEMAKRIVSSDRFVPLPTKFDVHEWEIMREFSDSVESNKIRADLLNAIHGSGAFQHFKSAIRRHGIEPAWYEFRTEALKADRDRLVRRARHPMGIVQ